VVEWLVAHPWSALILAGAGGGVVALIALFGPRERSATRGATTTTTTTVPTASRGGGLVLAWALPVIIVGVMLVIAALFIYGECDKRRRWRTGDRGARIEALSRSLQDALTLIDTVRRDIDRGEGALKELERQSRYQQEIGKLSAEEAAAVRELVREEFRNEGKTSLRRDITIAAAFFAMGTVVSLLLR